MAFDGIVIANLVHDIRQKLEGGKINKIAQPEKDELMFTVKNNKETLRLSVSAPGILHRDQQAKPADRTELLHAAEKAYRNRTHRQSIPAGT